ncbi:NAD(P)-binding protein [Coniophora puteana RWD-64-598 SS2]|uniref:NAD(P)-binding protein n=1 Tax=Coniophora puteana (strain RWD-64-598) TaxID=741705 RepID=A0A5M3MHA5_CONPW|nr:NAD(P)-binding protein [Coniophora puteana RWD-64-598 SS2]EIW78001.1 NAD(P)-binding protein [Coniophora puteana RWD-64-598 SS2]
MSLLVLSASDVDRITVNLSPTGLIQSMVDVFSTVSRSSSPSAEEAYCLPHRTTINMSHHKSLFMPSRVASIGTAIKIVSVPTSPVAQSGGLPASTLVLDEQTGRAKAIVNARSLTALRNAAGSALATKLALSFPRPRRDYEPRVLVLFGAGQQIAAHAHLFLRVFPSLKECHIINRSDNARLQDLTTSLERAYPTIIIQSHAGDRRTVDETNTVVGSADIICTATSSTAPLFPADLVKTGAHLNLIGSFTSHMKEISVELVHRAGPVIVETAEAALAEAGELIEAGYERENVVEIGKLINSGEERRSFYSRAVDVTIFKSVGIGLQDVAIASLVVKKAKELGWSLLFKSFSSAADFKASDIQAVALLCVALYDYGISSPHILSMRFESHAEWAVGSLPAEIDLVWLTLCLRIPVIIYGVKIRYNVPELTLLLIRVCAVYNNNSKMKLILCFLLSLEVIVTLYGQFGSNSHNPFRYAMLVYVPILSFECLLLALLLYGLVFSRTASLQLNLNKENRWTSLLMVVLRDGCLYFVITPLCASKRRRRAGHPVDSKVRKELAHVVLAHGPGPAVELELEVLLAVAHERLEHHRVLLALLLLPRGFPTWPVRDGRQRAGGRAHAGAVAVSEWAGVDRRVMEAVSRKVVEAGAGLLVAGAVKTTAAGVEVVEDATEVVVVVVVVVDVTAAEGEGEERLRVVVEAEAVQMEALGVAVAFRIGKIFDLREQKT